MADEATDAVSSEEDGGGGGGKKTIIMIAGMLIVEAVVLVGAFMVLGGDPAVSNGDMDPVSPEAAALEKIVEIEVLNTRLPNAKQGVTFLYDSRIYAQVRAKHEGLMTMELEQFQNEINAEIAGIWRTSDPAVFSEPRLETLTRKLEVLFRERLGTSPESGEPVVEKIVIVLGPGFRIDS